MKKHNFIYEKFSKIRNKIKTLHQQILGIKESDLEKTVDRNPYEILKDWIFEIVQYGTLFTITLIIFNIDKLTLLTWIIPIGIFRWLIFDMIKTFKKVK